MLRGRGDAEVRPGLEDLRRVTLLADLPEEDLAWIAERSEVRSLANGEAFVHAGDPAEHLHLLFSGQIEYTGEVGGQPIHWVVTGGEVSGLLPHSRMTHFPSTGRAVGLTRLATFPGALFGELRERIPALEPRFMAVLADRIRVAAQADEQRERLSALGKLSAGLAHELNNPAAAVRSAAGALEGRLGTLPDLLRAWLEAAPDPRALEALEEAARAAARRMDERLTPLRRSELEDEVADWLGDEGVGNAEERAGTLVEAGVRLADLTRLQAACPQGCAPGVAYLEFRLASLALLRDVQHAAGRISDLVSSVKTYSHMDRGGGDRTCADVRRGLDSTVTMLAYKLRSKRLGMTREYAPDLPPVLADEGALNQVWTNLIVNAVDALPEGGQITLRAERRGEQVAVSVNDDGPGIPPEIQGRVFEPFFTTKPVGEGSGLGLDLVGRIVMRQHGGTVRLSSEPGRTEFLVLLPAALERAEGH